MEIYYEALRKGTYTCYLKEDSRMPMMFMPDCLDATLSLLTTNPSNLKQRVYNVTAMSFTPAELAASIQKVPLLLSRPHAPMAGHPGLHHHVRPR